MLDHLKTFAVRLSGGLTFESVCACVWLGGVLILNPQPPVFHTLRMFFFCLELLVSHLSEDVGVEKGLEKNLLVIVQKKHDSDASSRCVVYTEEDDHDVCGGGGGGGGAAEPRLVEL